MTWSELSVTISGTTGGCREVCPSATLVAPIGKSLCMHLQRGKRHVLAKAVETPLAPAWAAAAALLGGTEGHLFGRVRNAALVAPFSRIFTILTENQLDTAPPLSHAYAHAQAHTLIIHQTTTITISSPHDLLQGPT